MSQQIIFGYSPAFKRVLEIATKYAASDWPVLIQGETGVGKELVAQRIHRESSRARGPFLAVNCGAIPAGLFESELFGHERGAFSGALQSSRGLFRQANGGTLFLDEIGELELSLQVKLLRLIETGEVRAVGSTKTESASVRILAATNVDLDGAVAEGTFRQDLLERISVLSLKVPALRERAEDIPAIARHWMGQLGVGAEAAVLERLSAFAWPGNVRQLRNVLIRASLLSRQEIEEGLIIRLLKEEGLRTAAVTSRDLLQGSLAEIEKQVIVGKLRQCGGNRKRTAKELGIAKSTLHDKLRKWKGGDHLPGGASLQC